MRFDVADALALPYPDGSFDVASIAFGIRNVDDPVRCLREMGRVARTVVVLEFGQPKGPFGAVFRTYSRRVVMPSSRNRRWTASSERSRSRPPRRA